MTQSPAPPPPVPPPPPVSPDASIVLTDVSKSFGQLVAVSDISLGIGPGVTALLGPNGAGKSTLLRLICGLARPSSGRVWVAGGDPRTSAEVRGRIGLVPQQDGVFERETVSRTVNLAATLSGVPDPAAATAKALGQVDLDPDITRPVGTFSKGMRQRVKIAQALVHDPTVLVLDEPLNGLDPIQRRSMIELFHRLGQAGRTVLVSSHVLDEVERLGSHIVVVARGRLAARGDFRQIRAMMDRQPHRLRIQCSDPTTLGAELLRSGTITGCEVGNEGRLDITTTTAPEFRQTLPVVCRRLGVELTELQPLDDDLESVFHLLLAGGGQ